MRSVAVRNLSWDFIARVRSARIVDLSSAMPRRYAWDPGRLRNTRSVDRMEAMTNDDGRCAR
jgi:hypothetical protein